MSTMTSGDHDETVVRFAVGAAFSLPAGLLLNLNLGAASIAANGAHPSPSLDAGFLARAAAWSLFLFAVAGVGVLWRSRTILSTARRGAWLIASMCLLMIPLAQPAIEFVAACGRITVEQQTVQFIPFATTIASDTVRGLAIAGVVLCACVLLALRLSVRSVPAKSPSRRTGTA